MAVSKATIHSEIEQLAGLHHATEAENVRLREALDASVEENRALQAHLDAQERRLTQLEELSARLGGGGDDDLVRLQRELARRDQVIEVLQEALRTHEALLQDADSEDDDIDENDVAAHRRRLATARQQIRALKNDLRVRGDVIDALESDAVALQIAQAQLEENTSHNNVLRNELGLALNEIARLCKREQNGGRGSNSQSPPEKTTAERASDVAALLVRLEQSEAHNRTLESTVAALERLLAANENAMARCDEPATASRGAERS